MVCYRLVVTFYFCMFFRTFATVRNPSGHEKRSVELKLRRCHRGHRYTQPECCTIDYTYDSYA